MDKLTPERRSLNMRQIRSTGTAPEIAVRQLVHGMGYRYRLHSAKHQHGECVDSHIPKSRLHYWLPKLQRNQARDVENLAKLKALGWRVLVVWECETGHRGRLQAKLRRFLGGP